jgi:hypothetical protein
MCAVSMVFDQYRPRFNEHLRSYIWPPAQAPGPEVAELRALIAEFREAVAAARAKDKAEGAPDCEDPQKAKLEQRVAELERRLGPA